jgi:hypothetical protein
MNKASVLMDVVAILEHEMRETAIIKHKEMGFTGKNPNQRVIIESTTTATHAAIEFDIIVEVLTKLINHFQDAIEAEISAYEISQGM